MSIHLQLAEKTDFPFIVALMNAAFRGAEGWSVETNYIAGQRTSEPLLNEEIQKGARYLLAKNEVTSELDGCVSLKALAPEKWYLGALTVNPALQNAGFGRRLLEAAEAFAAAQGARTVEITVINVREALIAWYERRGYRRTGATRAFPHGDDRYGTPTRNDLEFVVFEKELHA